MVIERLYRHLTTVKLRVYNGVVVRNRHPMKFDDHYPDHKQTLTEAVYENVNPDDDVVTIGGGKGVIETHIARITGSVETYDAGYEMVTTCRETAKLNDVDIDVTHGIVGTVTEAYGSTEGAENVTLSELEGDVAVLDCEGAEMDILPLPQFETVIVETHPKFDAKTLDVVDKLDGQAHIYGEDEQDGHVVIRDE